MTSCKSSDVFIVRVKLSRFVSLEDDDILKIIDDKDAKATKNVIATGVARNLHEYLQVKDGQLKKFKKKSTRKGSPI